MFRPFLPGIVSQQGLEYIGSVTKAADDVGDFNTPAEAIDVLSVASVNDLVVIAFSFDDSGRPSFTWSGMDFTEIYYSGTGENTGYYVGYHKVQSGDANPYIGDIGSFNFYGLSIVAAVFSGRSTLKGSASATGTGANADPPNLTQSGSLWVATAHADGVDTSASAPPSGFTMAGTVGANHVGDRSMTAIAYKIENQSSDNPDTFTHDIAANWFASTLAF